MKPISAGSGMRLAAMAAMAALATDAQTERPARMERMREIRPDELNRKQARAASRRSEKQFRLKGVRP